MRLTPSRVRTPLSSMVELCKLSKSSRKPSAWQGLPRRHKLLFAQGICTALGMLKRGVRSGENMPPAAPLVILIADFMDVLLMRNRGSRRSREGFSGLNHGSEPRVSVGSRQSGLQGILQMNLGHSVVGDPCGLGRGVLGRCFLFSF